MQQLEKSDNARNNTEEKLKELQKDLGECFCFLAPVLNNVYFYFVI